MQILIQRAGCLAITIVTLSQLASTLLAAQAEEPTQLIQCAPRNAAFLHAPNQSVVLASCCQSDNCAISPDCCDDTACCDASCGGCQRCGFGSGWLSHLTCLIAPSERCFDEFISPMTNPVHFEDPRTLTEARFIYFRHKVPSTALGGTVNLVACQLRAALSERLSIIATKDGFLTSSNPLIDDGWADINVGLKYNLFRCPECQFLYTLGATYEAPFGSTRAIQGNGDGTFHLFSTIGKRYYGCNFLWGKGWILPVDTDEESSWFYMSGHVSRRLGQSKVYALAEMNWYTWFDSGSGGVPGIEGLDVFNFGSTNVKDNDIVTGTFGLKYKPAHDVEIGLAWENPLTKRRDIIDNRLTFDCILRY